MEKSIASVLLLLLSFISCGQKNNAVNQIRAIQKEHPITAADTSATTDTATLAAGCFWCVEAQFMELKGVMKVQSGYTGGHLKDPTYEQVCSGSTGHAEAINITYDPREISYDKLLSVFFLVHDPTQLNRQGNDIGTQYRSAVFPRNEEQKQSAERYIKELNEKKVYGKPVVTTIEPFTIFFNAEAYHDNYYARNPQNTYCQRVVKPKLDKFREVFREDLK